MSEIGAQKRFRIHATSTPIITALVCKTEEGRCILRTHVNRLPYAHGYQLGDLVKIFPLEAGATLLEPSNEERTDWKEEEYPASARFDYDMTAVVDTDSADPSMLLLYMPPVADVGTSSTP